MACVARRAGMAAAALALLLLPALASAQHLSLVDLPYTYDALEPWLDGPTMRLHHLGHHAGYVLKANAALAALRGAPETNALAKLGLDALLLRLADVPEPQRGALRAAGGGVVNHELWWSQLAAPAERGGGGGAFDASSELGAAILARWVSLEVFQEVFKAHALGVFGSGWAWLELDMRGVSDGAVAALALTTTPNQDSPLMEAGRVPLIALDAWEHAYYLKYPNKRGDYIDAFWHVLDWRAVEVRYSDAITPMKDAQALHEHATKYPLEGRVSAEGGVSM